MKEVDLAKPIISWLQEQNWDVYQEVQFHRQSNIADIVAVRHNLLWIIECKTAYGFDVLEQATRWPVHYRSVAVPYAKDRNYHVAQYYYQVGVLEVRNFYGTPSVTEVVSPHLFSKNRKISKHYREYLQPLHKTFAEAGHKGSQHLTPYKQTIMEVKKFISNHPGCSMGELYDTLGKMHYASMQSFKGSLLKSLQDFEKDWCRIDTTSIPYRLYLK